MCSCQMSGMKRKRISGLKMGGIVPTLTQQVLPAAAGFLVGQILTKQLTFLSTNTTVGNLVKVAGGAILAGQRGGFISAMGVGLAAQGAVGFIQPMVDGAGISLLPPGVPSRYLAGFDVPDVATPNGVGVGF